MESKTYEIFVRDGAMDQGFTYKYVGTELGARRRAAKLVSYRYVNQSTATLLDAGQVVGKYIRRNFRVARV